jgi:hypothetical protein
MVPARLNEQDCVWDDDSERNIDSLQPRGYAARLIPALRSLTSMTTPNYPFRVTLFA